MLYYCNQKGVTQFSQGEMQSDASAAEEAALTGYEKILTSLS
jgi:hypothetical protein